MKYIIIPDLALRITLPLVNSFFGKEYLNMLLAVPTVSCQSDIFKPVSDVANERLGFDMLVGKSVELALEKGGLNVIDCCCLIIFSPTWLTP